MSVVPYNAPEWVDAELFKSVPTTYAPLARRETALEPWTLSGLPEDTRLLIKRDDATGDVLLSGNKVRKLEFLLAEAKAQNCDVCVTVGGSQSNHARATVAAARRLGLEPHIVLRDDSHCHTEPQSGNAFLCSVLGAQSTTFPNEGFVPAARLQETVDALAAAGRRPYSVPLGGSNALSCWGYIQCFDEIVRSMSAKGTASLPSLTTVVAAVGSGTTSLGLGIGARLWSTRNALPGAFTVAGYTVANNPDHYYAHHDKMLGALLSGPHFTARDVTVLRQATGLGYGKASPEELQFLSRVARETGVLLDPSYTNKAAFNMVKDSAAGALLDSTGAPSRSLVFVHTGGAAGVFAFASHIDKATVTTAS